jgi:NAD(P)H dehydrogenase (quinone)
MYGHVAKLAEAEKKGVEAAGGKADIYQFVLPSSITHEAIANRQTGSPRLSPRRS